jgi:GTP-binding protein
MLPGGRRSAGIRPALGVGTSAARLNATAALCKHPPPFPPTSDVPGLLEGAHAGVGLGHQFLRHCQRCRLLVHVVDGTSPDPMGDYAAIRQELELFSPELAAKPQVRACVCLGGGSGHARLGPAAGSAAQATGGVGWRRLTTSARPPCPQPTQVVAYNKMDVPDSSDYWEDVREGLAARGVPRDACFAIRRAPGGWGRVAGGAGHTSRDRLDRPADSLPLRALQTTP